MSQIRAGRALAALMALIVTLTVAPAPAAAAAPAGARTPAGARAPADRHRPGQRFTLVVLPDTQLAVQNNPELFTAQTRWILDQRRPRHIPFVIHVGDVVEWPSRATDWERATTAMYPLNGVVPYAISVGNHDLDAWACTPAATCNPNDAIAVDRSTTMFNKAFPWLLFARWRGPGGSFPAGRSDNTYLTFTAGGVDWLVLSLKYQPTDAELAWGARVVARNPRRQVIINTHEYQLGAERTAVGERIWNAVARRYRNVQFVVSGHYVSAGTRVDNGDHGNTVYQLQADYQTYSLPQVVENSYLRLLDFDTRAGTVEVRTFSPYCAATGECPAEKTDADNQFRLTGVAFPGRRG